MKRMVVGWLVALLGGCGASQAQSSTSPAAYGYADADALIVALARGGNVEGCIRRSR